MKPLAATPESSNVAGASYSRAKETLTIMFRNHDKPAVYVYSNIPAEVAADFWNAKSLGKFVNTTLRQRVAAGESEATKQDASLYELA